MFSHNFHLGDIFKISIVVFIAGHAQQELLSPFLFSHSGANKRAITLPFIPPLNEINVVASAWDAALPVLRVLVSVKFQTV